VDAAKADGVDVGDLRWLLMHDASEAYLVDIPRPLKADPYFGKTYRGAEARAMAAVCARFNLDPREPVIVKLYDTVLLVTEKRDLMAPTPGLEWDPFFDDFEPLPDVITPWHWRKAKQRFLARFAELFPEEVKA
jgi:hypothetical protein